MNNLRQQRPVSMGNWMITMIVLAIPFLNLFMLVYWAFTSSTHPCKRTYCQAILMFGLIAIGLVAGAAILKSVLHP